MRHTDEGLLQAWLDGPRAGLTEEERAAVEDHLAGCAECAARVDGLRESTGRVGAMLGPSDGESVPGFEEVVDRARTLGVRDRRRRRWVAAGWAASVVLALGAGWLASELSRERPDAAASAARVADAARSSSAVDASRPATPIAEAGPPESEPAQAIPTDEAPVLAETSALASTGGAETGALAEAPAPVPATEAPATEPEAARRAREPVVVQGRVTAAATGQPIQGAQVFVEGTSEGTVTGPDGTFALGLAPKPDSAPRTVTIVAALIGYGSERRPVALERGDAVLGDFRLESEAISLDEIVVSGYSAATARNVERDSAADGARLRVPSFESDPGAWRVVPRAEAAALMEFPVRTVPDLPIVDIRVATVEQTPVVRVVQQLGGERLILLQATRPLALEDQGTEAFASTTLEDGVFVMARAALPTDSIRALLSGIR
jgi:hypothetical protein